MNQLSEKRFVVENGNNEVSIKDKEEDNYPFVLAYEHIDDADNLIQECLSLVGLLNEQQELIEELQASDEMGWKRAERFEKKCPKELHNKKMYIKRLEYKVQKFKEENEQLRMKLKGDDYIMVSEMLSNLRKTGICDGCKNKDKPVEWYLERGFSITGRVCDRYEPE